MTPWHIYIILLLFSATHEPSLWLVLIGGAVILVWCAATAWVARQITGVVSSPEQERSARHSRRGE